MQAIITIKPILHRGEEQLAIFFPFNKNIDYAIRSIKGIKWTQTHKCWYLPLNKGSFEAVKIKLQDLGTLEYSELKVYLEKRNKIIAIKKQTSPLPDYGAFALTVSLLLCSTIDFWNCSGVRPNAPLKTLIK